MAFQKITNGYVVQSFNDDGVCENQEFIACDPVEYENEEGESIDAPENEKYQPFNMIQPHLVEDIDGLTNYIFEFEIEDFITCLINEPLYVEEGIITKDKIYILEEYRNDSDEVIQIVERAAQNSECKHIYALASRVYKSIIS